MIPLEKQRNTVKCKKHPMTSLISNASKVMIKILMRKLKSQIESYLGEDQFGFRKGIGKRGDC